MKTADVAVIGLGIAGSSAFKILQNSGLSLIAFEALKIPRYKPCAGGLTKKACRVLKDIFKTDITVPLKKPDKLILKNDPYEISVPAEDAFCGFADRFELDFFLVSSLRGNIHDAERVLSVEKENDVFKIKTTKDIYRAKVVIGADGVNSIVSRLSGLKLKKGITYEIDVEAESELLCDFTKFGKGYFWAFPKFGAVTCGIGFFDRRRLPQIKEILHFYMKKNNIKGSVIREGGAFIPSNFSFKRSSGEGFLICGDAAGFVDPLTGEGIYFAAESGRLAAESVLRAFSKGDFSFKDYRKNVKKTFGKELKFAWLTSLIFYSFKDKIFPHLLKNSHAAKVAADLLSGNITYSKAFKEFLLSPLKG